MSTFAEIETAADALPSEQKEELLRFLAMRLRKERTLPKPRIYSEEELASMLAEDQRATGMASEWLRTAKGSVRVAVGKSVTGGGRAPKIGKKTASPTKPNP